IGIITTVFTAFLVTRWLIAFWLRRTKPKELPRGMVKFIPEVTTFRFMWLRKWSFSLSTFLAVLAVALFFTMNMNLGIDFRGGSMMEVQARAQQADAADVRGRLTDLNLGEVQVQEFGSPRELLIRIGAQGDEAAEQQVMQQVRTTLEAD